MKVIKARVVFSAGRRRGGDGGRGRRARNFTAFSSAERCLRYDYAITSESTSSHSAMPRYLLVNPKNPRYAMLIPSNFPSVLHPCVRAVIDVSCGESVSRFVPP